VRIRLPKSGGWFLVFGGLGYFMFWWNSTTLSPTWFQNNPIAEFWPATLGLHGLTLALLIVGFLLIGRDLDTRGASTGLWWIGLTLAVLGLTVGHPFWVAALMVIALVEVTAHRRWWVAAMLSGGALLWLAVFLAGAHLGDDRSRPPQGVEPWIALVGLVMMSVGLVVLGWSELRTEGGQRAEAGQVAVI
jgi:hypothetical protein